MVRCRHGLCRVRVLVGVELLDRLLDVVLGVGGEESNHVVPGGAQRRRSDRGRVLVLRRSELLCLRQLLWGGQAVLVVHLQCHRAVGIAGRGSVAGAACISGRAGLRRGRSIGGGCRVAGAAVVAGAVAAGACVVAGATVVASLAVSSSSPHAAKVRAAAAAVARIIRVFIILLRVVGSRWTASHSSTAEFRRTTVLPRSSVVMQASGARFVAPGAAAHATDRSRRSRPGRQAPRSFARMSDTRYVLDPISSPH